MLMFNFTYPVGDFTQVMYGIIYLHRLPFYPQVPLRVHKTSQDMMKVSSLLTRITDGLHLMAGYIYPRAIPEEQAFRILMSGKVIIIIFQAIILILLAAYLTPVM